MALRRPRLSSKETAKDGHPDSASPGAPAALAALVRLLARQAAREFILRVDPPAAPATDQPALGNTDRDGGASINLQPSPIATSLRPAVSPVPPGSNRRTTAR